MSGSWRTATVSELQRERVLLVEDGNHGEYRPRPNEFVDHGVAFIRAADIGNGRIRFDSASKIDDTARRRITKGIGAPGDAILSHKGTVGKVAYAHFGSPRFVCSPQTTFWRSLDDKVLDQRYLFAFLRSPGFHAQLATRAGDTDMAPYVSLTSQRGLSVTIPPMDVQRFIAQIVSSLDDRIELNRCLNETLEAMARAIFKSWFVDFDPTHKEASGRPPFGMNVQTAAFFSQSFQGSPLGDIPRNWDTGPILASARLLGGGTPKTNRAEYWSGPVLWASAKDVSQCRQVFLLTTERTLTLRGVEESSAQIIPTFSTVVVARGATTGRMALLGNQMAMNQICYALVSLGNAPFYLYCLLRHAMDGLVHAAHGSVFDTITTTTFAKSQVVLPPGALIASFERQVAPLFELLLINLEESSTLAQIRDSLLPKLISGEIRIDNAEKLLGARL